MAQIDLGSIKFNWKGSYSGATAYVVDDVVESSGSSYICITATTGNAPPNATYWEQMSSAGTNGTDGTDLGTVLTTQGDLVYRDGSGLQRLAAGTSGQVLQTNGIGANPSWGTVSSDFVKIAEVNITTNTAIATFDNVFSSSDGYDNYFLTFRQMIPATNSVALRIRYLNSSGSTVSANYRWVNNGSETNNSGAANNGQIGGAYNDSEYQVAGVGGSISNNTNNNGVSGTVNFYNPELSGKTQAIGDYVMVRNPLDNLFQMAHASVIEDTQVMRGFIMYFSSGDIANGKMTLYGRK